MLPIATFFTVMLALVALAGLWVRRKWRQTEGERLSHTSALGESARFDVESVRDLPVLRDAVAGVKLSKLQRQGGGRAVVGGIAVFGPQNLTWAPDERARAAGVLPWKLAWSELTGSSVRTRTATTSAVLTLTLVGGHSFDLVGVDEVRALAAIRRAAGGPAATESDPPEADAAAD